MNIAVLFGEIGFISRREILDGIQDCARKSGDNVFLFTAEGLLYHSLSGFIGGEYNIFNLPSLEMFDGVIVDLNSIQNADMQKKVTERILAAKIPCVSYDREIGDADVITFDNQSALSVLLEHMITEHGYRDFFYVSGPLENYDAIQRWDVFKRVLTSHGLPVSDEKFYEGNFNCNSGRWLAQKILNENIPLPEVFVAANDFMAIGLMEELRKAGIKIPEDVAVTGYDYAEMTRDFFPELATIDRNEFLAGKCAYERLMDVIASKRTEKQILNIEGRVIYSGTCGCKTPASAIEAANQDGKKAWNISLQTDQSMDLIKGLTLELSFADTFDRFVFCLEKYIERMGMEYFYYCQCGSREEYYDELDILASGEQLDRDTSEYQDTAWCPVAYENGEWNTYPKFDIHRLLPPGHKVPAGGGYYIVMPIHQEEVCIGYGVIGNYHVPPSGRVLQHLFVNIGNALGNIRKHDIMNSMMAKINRKWRYDELTGLYNRSGMYDQVKKRLKNLEHSTKGVAVCFFDLNELKQINDRQGHDAGDQYIKIMADMLARGCEENDIVVRYGGDEYLVISEQDSPEDGQIKMRELRAKLLPPVSASGGMAYGQISDIAGLNVLIECADKKMYEEKRKYKISTGAVLL